MAYRITPRVSQMIRAVEDAVRRQVDQRKKPDDPPVGISFDCGDFKFGDNDAGDTTEVAIIHVAVAYTLADDRDCFLDIAHFEGSAILRKHAAVHLKKGRREWLYSVQEIHLRPHPKAVEF
jgi:hypothetical protein